MSSCDEDLLGRPSYSGDCGVPAGASYSASATPSPTAASAAAYPSASSLRAVPNRVCEEPLYRGV